MLLRCWCAQVDAIRRGLLATVPERAVRLATWQELDVWVAGRPDINVDVLEKHTEYEGYRRDDPTVKLFWKVFRSLSNEDRTLFVRFAWGRSVPTYSMTIVLDAADCCVGSPSSPVVLSSPCVRQVSVAH